MNTKFVFKVLFIIVCVLAILISFAVKSGGDYDGENVVQIESIVKNDSAIVQTEEVYDQQFIENEINYLEDRIEFHSNKLNYFKLKNINQNIIDLYERYLENDQQVLNYFLEQNKQSISDEEILVDEFPVASTIYNFLKEAGYNEFVCSGLIGNIMVECGGNTLKDIRVNLYSKQKTHYGICQWSKKYYPDVIDMNLDYQLNYLLNTIEYQMNTYGYLYQKNFSYNSFIQLQDEKQVALAFAKCYERCGTGSYHMRKVCATIAYNYFVK